MTCIIFHYSDGLYIDEKPIESGKRLNFCSNSVVVSTINNKPIGRIFKSKKRYNIGCRLLNWLNGIHVIYEDTFAGDSIVNVYKTQSKWAYVAIASCLVLLLFGAGISHMLFAEGRKDYNVTSFEYDSAYGEDITSLRLIPNDHDSALAEMQIGMITLISDNSISESYRLHQDRNRNDAHSVDERVVISVPTRAAWNKVKDSKIVLIFGTEYGLSIELSYTFQTLLDSSTLNVKSPVKMHVNQVKSYIDDGDFETAYQNSRNVRNLENANAEILTKLSEKMQEVSDVTMLAPFVNKYSNATDSFYMIVKERCDTLKKLAEEKSKKAHMENLRKAAIEMKDKLWANTCTAKTVEAVEKWYTKLEETEKSQVNKIYKFKPAIEAYNAFFECAKAKSSIDAMRIVHKKYLRYFSEYQQRVIKAYTKDSKTHRYLKERYGITFHVPQTMINSIISK